MQNHDEQTRCRQRLEWHLSCIDAPPPPVRHRLIRTIRPTMKIVELARFVDDVPKAIEFYRLFLGVEPSYSDDSLATFYSHGVTVLVHHRYEPGPGDLPCEDHIAFGADDVDQTVAVLEQQGLIVEHPPRDYDWGRSAYLREPSGSLIEIAQNSPNDHT